MLHELQHEHEKLAKACQGMGDQQVQDCKERSRQATELERELTAVKEAKASLSRKLTAVEAERANLRRELKGFKEEKAKLRSSAHAPKEETTKIFSCQRELTASKEEITKLRALISGMPETRQHGRHSDHHGDRHYDRHGGRHGGRYKCGDRGQGHWHSGSHWANPFGYSFGNALEDLSKVWDDAVKGWDA